MKRPRPPDQTQRFQLPDQLLQLKAARLVLAGGISRMSHTWIIEARIPLFDPGSAQGRPPAGNPRGCLPQASRNLRHSLRNSGAVCWHGWPRAVRVAARRSVRWASAAARVRPNESIVPYASSRLERCPRPILPQAGALAGCW